MFYATIAGLFALAGVVLFLAAVKNKQPANGRKIPKDTSTGNSTGSGGASKAPVDAAVDMSATDFEVLRTNATTPFIAVFHAAGCPACVKQKPVFDRVARDHVGKVKFVKISTDENRSLSRRMGVSRIPTLLVFKPNVADPVATHVGMLDDERLKSFVDSSIAGS